MRLTIFEGLVSKILFGKVNFIEISFGFLCKRLFPSIGYSKAEYASTNNKTADFSSLDRRKYVLKVFSGNAYLIYYFYW